MNPRVLRSARERRGGSRNSPPLPQVMELVPFPSGAPYSTPRPGARRAGSGQGGGVEGWVRGVWASSEQSGGKGSCEVTHRLGNNRTDKLLGMRRSQARVCGRRLPDVPGGPGAGRGGGGRKAPSACPRGVFKKKTETPTTSLAFARRRLPRLDLLPLLLPCLRTDRLPRTCGTMSLAWRPKQPALPRAPEPESRTEWGVQAERAARGPGRSRLSPPPPLRSPTWRGPRVRSVQRGAELGSGPGTPPLPRDAVAPRSPATASPSRLPVRNYLPPRLRIQPPRLKFTLAGRAGSGFPLHRPAARFTLPRASSRIRARKAALGPSRPFLPGAGWRSPRIELVGLLRRTFFSMRRPQHHARLGSGSLRAGKSPGLTPSSPAPLLPPAPRKWGQWEGGGEEPAGTGSGG